MDELIKQLRQLASIPEHCENVADCDKCTKEEICLSFTNKRIIEVATQAADAIEGLSKEVDKWKAKYAECFHHSMELFEENQNLQDVFRPLHEPRWIPVTERLPEFDQKVLAWVKNKDSEGRFNKDGIYTAELKDKMPRPDPEGKRNFWGMPGYDSVWTVWSWSYFTEPDVLFWMPLPEPPKEE